jgi:hypothetical protein
VSRPHDAQHQCTSSAILRSERRPLGGDNNIYQYDTSGDFKQNQFIVNGNVRMGSKLSLFGYYTLSYASSNTSGVTSIAPRTNTTLATGLRHDTAFDIRNRFFLRRGGAHHQLALTRIPPQSFHGSRPTLLFPQRRPSARMPIMTLCLPIRPT